MGLTGSDPKITGLNFLKCGFFYAGVYCILIEFNLSVQKTNLNLVDYTVHSLYSNKIAGLR